MIELPSERSAIRPWVICESGARWITAVRRFVTPMMPSPLVASVVPADPAQTRSLLTGERAAVVVWEIRPETLNATCEWVVRTSLATPRVLQLVALSGAVSPKAAIVLSELRVTATLRHPEDLPPLNGLIQGYFARSGQAID